jgi:hypothetical protein
MDTLKKLVRHVVEGYAGNAYNGQLHLTVSPAEDVFSVIGVGVVNGQRFVTIGLVARIVGDQVIIEQDLNDKPLVDALIQAGVPREKIILAYAGEAVPDTTF